MTKDEEIRMINEKLDFYVMEATQCTPSLSQSIRIKKLSEAGKLTESEAEGILGEIKQKEADRVVFKNEQLYRSHTIAVEIG